MGRERKVEDVLADIAKNTRNMPLAMQQGLVEKIFKGNPEALRLTAAFRQNPQLLQAAQRRAETLGTLLSPRDLVVIQTFKRDVGTLKEAWEGVRIAIARRVIPTLDDLARRATAFLVTYRTNIADVVATQFNRFVRNAVQLGAVVQREFHVVERLVAASQRYLRTGVDWVMVGYGAYLRYVKPEFSKVLGWYRSMAQAARDFAHDSSAAWKATKDPLSGLHATRKESTRYLPGVVKQEIADRLHSTKAVKDASVAHHELKAAMHGSTEQVRRFRWLIPVVDVLKIAGVAIKNLSFLVSDLYHSFKGDVGVRHFGWVDGFTRKVKSAGRAIASVAKDAWAALRGDKQAVSGNDRFFAYLAEKRNAIVAWVKQAAADVVGVFENGVSDSPLETWLGRVVNDIAWFVQRVPVWFDEAKKAVAAGVRCVMDAFAELQMVLGGGAGERGQSTRWPWLTSLVEGIDAVVERITKLGDMFKATYDAAASLLNPLLKFAGTDLSSMLLYVTFGRLLAGFLGLGPAIGGVIKLLAGGALANALNPVVLIVAGLAASIAMIAEAIANFRKNADLDALAQRFAPGAGKEDYRAVAAYNDDYMARRSGAIDPQQAFRDRVEAQSDDLLKRVGDHVADAVAPAQSQRPFNLYVGDTVVEASTTQDQFARLQSDAAVRTSPTPKWNQ